jgi:hypothetical protein
MHSFFSVQHYNPSLRGVPIAIGTTWQSVASTAIAPVIAGLLFSAVLKANTLNQWIFP